MKETQDKEITEDKESVKGMKNFESRRKKVRILFIVLASIIVLTIIASIVIYFVEGRSFDITANTVFLCSLTLFLFFIPVFLEKKLKIIIPNYILIILFAFMFSHFIIGEVYRAFDLPIYDKILHTISGVILTLIGFSLVSLLNDLPKNKYKLSPFFIALFSFCVAMTWEYLWEIYEFTIDSIQGANMQRWKDGLVSLTPNVDGTWTTTVQRGSGLVDTMIDMIVNIFGSLAVCIYGYIGLKLKPNWFSGKVAVKHSDINYLTKSNEEINIIDTSIEDNNLVEKEINSETDTKITESKSTEKDE